MNEAAYLEAICESYPDFNIETVRPHHCDGQFNDILIINDEFIFRFPRYARGIETIVNEILILSRIQDYLTLPIPNPIYVGKDTHTLGKVFMGYPLLPGEPLWHETLAVMADEVTHQRLTGQLANFLTELHQIPVESIGARLPVYDKPTEWAQLYTDIRHHLFPLMRPDACTQVSSHFETFLNKSDSYSYQPVLRHGDFGPGNILYDLQTQTISGVIDFAFAGLGDPATDIAAVSGYEAPFFEQFCRVYPVTKSMLERAKFYKGTFALQEALHGLLNHDQEAFKSGIADHI